MNAEIVYRGFAVLQGWADAYAILKMALTQLDAPTTFPTEFFWSS